MGWVSLTSRRSVRRGATLLLVCMLCVAGGAVGAVALAAPGHRSRHRSPHAAKACHRTRHSRCPKGRAGKAHRKHRRGASSLKPSDETPGSASKGSSSTGGSTAPAATGATPTTPGSTPGSGTTPPGPAGGAHPTESPSVPVAPARVQVTAEDTEGFRFVLSRTSVPAGKVIIEFVNHGQDEHNLHAVEPADGSEAGSLANTAPGAHPDLTLELRPGSYTLFCSLPGHEAKGMKATLVVQ